MLRLVGQSEGASVCPECSGRGRVPAPETTCVRTGIGGTRLHGGRFGGVGIRGGAPMPCPMCKGKKVVAGQEPISDLKFQTSDFKSETRH